jgi:uncharacterized phiE125 gp8 family phage protein
MSGLTLITPPAVEPVSIAEVKAQLRMDFETADDDALLIRNIYTARSLIEKDLGRALITQTWMLSLDTVPHIEEPLWEGIRIGADIPVRASEIVLPNPPLQSVSSITSYDDSDNGTAFATSNYYVDTVADPGRVRLRQSATWPDATRVANAIEIVFVAGYGSSWNDVPHEIRQGILATIRTIYDECDGEGGALSGLPSEAATLLAAYRVLRPVDGGLGF